MGLFNNRKLIRKSAQSAAKSRQETRDAIVWDVLPEQRVCRVKIQGSNGFLYARYPQNWEATPEFLKPGNSVCIAHRGGNRNVFEVIGHGRSLPTFPNSTQASPPEGASVNAIISGFEVVPTSPPSMSVTVSSGIYRINNALYSMGNIEPVMGDDSDMLENSIQSMGNSLLNTVTLTPMLDLYKTRVDAIYVDTSGLLGVATGAEFLNSAEEITYPVVPAGTVKVAHVFVFGGVVQTDDVWVVNEYGGLSNTKNTVYLSKIEANQINKEWQKAVPGVLYITGTQNTTVECMPTYDMYPFLYAPIVFPDYPWFMVFTWRLLDQFSRMYNPPADITDDLVFEINNRGGHLGLTKSHAFISPPAGYYFEDLITGVSRWVSPVKAVGHISIAPKATPTGEFINHPIVVCYLKSSGVTQPLYSFTVVCGDGIGFTFNPLDNCPIAIPGQAPGE